MSTASQDSQIFREAEQASLIRPAKPPKVTPASQQSLAEAKDTIKQTLQSQNQQKALDAFVKDFTKRWKDKTECSEGYKTSDCKNGPKATPTPTAAGGTGAPTDGSTDGTGTGQ